MAVENVKCACGAIVNRKAIGSHRRSAECIVRSTRVRLAGAGYTYVGVASLPIEDQARWVRDGSARNEGNPTIGQSISFQIGAWEDGTPKLRCETVRIYLAWYANALPETTPHKDYALGLVLARTPGAIWSPVYYLDPKDRRSDRVDIKSGWYIPTGIAHAIRKAIEFTDHQGGLENRITYEASIRAMLSLPAGETWIHPLERETKAKGD